MFRQHDTSPVTRADCPQTRHICHCLGVRRSLSLTYRVLQAKLATPGFSHFRANRAPFFHSLRYAYATSCFGESLKTCLASFFTLPTLQNCFAGATILNALLHTNSRQCFFKNGINGKLVSARQQRQRYQLRGF